MESCGSGVQTDTRMTLSPTEPQFLCPEGSNLVPLSSNGGRTCTHRLLHTFGRITLSWSYLDEDLWQKICSQEQRENRSLKQTS